jgi:zinc protease
LLRGLQRNLSSPQQIATGALNEAIAQGDWRLMFLQHDRLEDVGPADVLRVAKAYFKGSNLTVGYYIPDDAPDRTVVPATPNLDSLFANYTSSVTVEHGEVFDPTPANIESRLTRSKLANGMKVVILPKKTESSTVEATIELRFGDAQTLKGESAAASFASGFMMRGGTRQHTRQQIQEELRKLDASVNIGGGGAGGRGGGGRGGFGGGAAPANLNATITAPSKNFIAALKIAAEILKEPAYAPESEFETMRAQRIKALELTPTEPTQLAAETLQRHMTPWSPGDVLYEPTREEQVAE